MFTPYGTVFAFSLSWFEILGIKKLHALGPWDSKKFTVFQPCPTIRV